MGLVDSDGYLTHDGCGGICEKWSGFGCTLKKHAMH